MKPSPLITDPKAGSYSGFSPYANRGCNPTRYLDPSGKMWVEEREHNIVWRENITAENYKDMLTDGEKFLGEEYLRQKIWTDVNVRGNSESGLMLEHYKPDGTMEYKNLTPWMDIAVEEMKKGDTLYAPADSIDRFLAADTVTHRRIINSWYAPGYRYPLIQQTINLIYVKGIENDRRVLTLYYPRQRQEEEITDDPDNQEIRDKNRFEGFMAANTPNADGSPHQSPSSPGGNRANDGDGNSGRASAGIAGNGAPGSGGWCDVSPVVATDKTVASICPAESGESIVTLTNNAGALMWSQKATAEGGTAISVECPMTDMAPGSYLITVSAPGLRRTFKIVKP